MRTQREERAEEGAGGGGSEALGEWRPRVREALQEAWRLGGNPKMSQVGWVIC